MTHDPIDVHVDPAAFWAAYKALQEAGITVAQVRADLSNLVAVAVLNRRTAVGLGHMLSMANSEDTRRPTVDELLRENPDILFWNKRQRRRILDLAVAAAAKALWGE
jgi:hypothetical protein